MTVITLTPQTLVAPFATVAANALDFTFAAGQAGSGGNNFVCSGQDLVVVNNSHGSNAYTVTITSVADEKNRTGHITSYSLAAGDYAVFGVGLTNSKGWQSTAGKIQIDVENAAVKVAILRLPSGYPGS